jgi:hypothetical protein
MTPKEILQQIIKHNGSCDWMNRIGSTYPFEDICNVCPIRMLPSKNNTDFNIIDRTCVMATRSCEDKVYLDLAIELLLSLQIEETIKEENVTGKP